MAKHRQATVSKWAPYVTTGIALNAATLFAFTYATDSHVTLNPLLSASTSIFVDGTKSVTGNEEGNPPYRMADAFKGKFDQTPGVVDVADSANNKFVVYPRSLGPLTGIGDPTYDVSEGLATDQVVDLVRKAKAPGSGYQKGVDTIYVVGYSQGAGAAVQAIPELETPEFAGDDIQFVLAANPRRNDGGILARLPKGVYVPILGVSFGDGTTPTNTHVLQVTKQYDGVADAPNYIFNVAADLNAILGFYYLHSGYYKDVDLTNVEEPIIDPVTGQPDRIVTKSADGRVTDVLLRAPVGELPLTMPLLQLGVPKEIVKALDPFLRAIIETGYARPNVVPAQPVPFQLVPPPSRWLPDLQSVATGAIQTGQALTGTTPPPPNPPPNNLVNQHVSTFVEKGPEVGGQSPVLNEGSELEQGSELQQGSELEPNQEQGDLEGQNPPPSGTPASEELVVDPTKTATPPTTLKAPKPLKFTPPHISAGGWKPGDLLRKIFNPEPKTGSDKQTTAPKPSDAPPAATNDDADPPKNPAADKDAA